jgi:hypothetical protein
MQSSAPVAVPGKTAWYRKPGGGIGGREGREGEPPSGSSVRTMNKASICFML